LEFHGLTDIAERRTLMLSIHICRDIEHYRQIGDVLICPDAVKSQYWFWTHLSV
jgi:hypothetical protein